jgi:peptidyl-dipeptidase Dcp
LREKVWRAFTMRGDNQNANDTNATIAEILKLRQQRAEILGFPTHAHYRMADTMAKDPNKAMDLMMKVWPAAAARCGVAPGAARDGAAGAARGVAPPPACPHPAPR